MNEFFDLAKKVLAEQLSIDSAGITMETTFEQINADSIDIVEMIMAIEDVYDVEFPEEDLEQFSTVGALLSALYSFLDQAKNE
ncbi:MAG: acyl carrier protein [Syntrophomonas sp.]